MTWLRSNLGSLIALAGLSAGALIGWGRMTQICAAMDNKADKQAVTREMDQLHDQLGEINRKLDALLLQRANNP